MTLRVGLVGYDLICKRIADAVALQPDMGIQGICEADPARRQVILAKGYAVWDGRVDELAACCDVIVNCSNAALSTGVPVIYGPNTHQVEVPLFSLLSNRATILHQPALKVPTADALAFARLIHALGAQVKIERLFSTAIVRAGHATASAAGCIDALEPIFDDSAERREIERVIGPWVAAHNVRRVRAPYTHSHLHMLKLDLADPVSRADVLELLARARRLVVGRGRDGLANTAQLQEFLRDLGRNRSDRQEVFVWAESVVVFERSVCLMMDVSPEATPVPEVIDAIRLRRVEGIDLMDSIARTDLALGIGRLETCPALEDADG